MGAKASKAAAAITVALVMTAGCGGGGGKTAARPEGGSAVTLTQAELEAAAVTGADLPGWRAPGGRKPRVAGARGKVPDAACQALYGMTAELGAERQPSRAAAQESVSTPDGAAEEHDVTVVLRAYTAADAVGLMKDLRTSLKTCPPLFDSALKGEKYGHTELLKDPAAGDDALAYRIVQTIPGEDPDDVTAPGHGLYHVVVVRCGATIASFSEFAMDGDPAAVPMAVVTAQTAKLAKAEGTA